MVFYIIYLKEVKKFVHLHFTHWNIHISPSPPWRCMADNSNIGLILLFEKKKTHGNLSLCCLWLWRYYSVKLSGFWVFFVSEQLFIHWIHSPREIICVTTEKLFFRMAEWCNNGPLKFDWLAASAGNQLYSREPVRFSGALNPSF